MEVRQLRYFVAVAEERSFTRAAARLHLSQQSLSAAIRRLEAQLGCRLLERTSRRVELTAAGRALLGRAPAVFAAMDAATAAAHEAAGGLRGALRVRYGLDSEVITEPLLERFQDRHPGVALSAWSGMDADNLSALRAGEVDAVLAWAAADDDLSARVVAHEQALLALPDRHRLAPLDVVPVQAIADEPLVMFPREGAPAVWDLLVGRLRPRDAAAGAPILRTPVSGQATMADRVLRGEGLCPISESLAFRIKRPGLVLRPLGPALRIPLLLVWRDQATALLQRLVDHLAGDGAQRVPAGAGGERLGAVEAR